MRKIKEVLSLHYDKGLSQNQIMDATLIKRSTVRDYISRAKKAGLTWPLSDDMTSEKLNDLLFPKKVNKALASDAMPDWDLAHKELRRKGVTLILLWEEYIQNHPTGIKYSWFAQQYRLWAKTKDVWMHQSYKAGEKAFVDYSGLTVPIWEPNLREIAYHAEIFVGVLGASDLIFCIATKTQRLTDWVDAHCRMLEYFGGVPEIVVPDNLRSGVTKSHLYEPTCNQTYLDAMRHYGAVVMPARVYRPKDKAKAEKSVQSIQQRVIAPLRDQKFISHDEYNTAAFEKLELINNKHFQKLDYSRRELFNNVEKEVLSPLPKVPYEFGEWFNFKLNGGYHVCIYEHNYSIPYTLVKKNISVRVTAKMIECFHDLQQVALHQRDDTPLTYTTVDEHRPEAHREQAQCCQEKLLEKAISIGANTFKLITSLFSDPQRHLHQKERSAQGILRLKDAYGINDFELACKTALVIGTWRYDSIESILKKRMFEEHETSKTIEIPSHVNLRGAEYYS